MSNSNNNNNNKNNMNSMPCPESEEEEEEFSGSYNINDNADCSSSNSSAAAASSSGKTASSSSSSSSDDDADEDDEDATDQDTQSDSDSDDATTTQSDELELAQFSDQHIFRLPRGLCERASIFHEFFSMETWQKLPTQIQAQLQPFLPSYANLFAPAQAAQEQERTLLQLFNGGLQHFGQSPLIRLQRQLEEGSLRPDVLQLRRSIERSKRRERRFQHAERLSRLAKELFLSREQFLQQAYNMAPPPEGDTFKAPSRPRKRKAPVLHRENKFCMERARKRYCQELADLARDLQLQPGDISADDQDEEQVAQLAAIVEQQKLKIETPTRPSNAADKKCIYNTFFKRRAGQEDEQVLRDMQSDKMQPLNERNLKKYLRDYKRRKMQQPHLPDFDTADIRLRDICTRAQFVGNFKPGRKPKALTARLNHNVNEPPALVPIGNNTNNNKAKQPEPMAELLTDEPQQLYGRAALQPDEEEIEQELQEPADIISKTMSPALLPKLEPIAARTTINSSPRALVKVGTHITGSPTRDALATTTATTTLARHGNACYFSLIRDLFVSTPQHRLNYAELYDLLLKWRTESCNGGLPDWLRQLPADWMKLLQSAINFLAGDFATLPAEYVPYIEHKTQLNIYQWIGAGRDSDARLQTLCQYWLQRRKEDTSIPSPQQQQQLNAKQQQQLSPVVDVLPTPPPRCPTSWSVRVATQAEMLEFQRQERLRFEQPHRPFTYRMHGYESVVGPVKGIYTQSLALNKARGHAVMVDDRPPYVTILTLVRDATARLPNGEGTRSEISELLKCSQFINRQAAENVLQTIVSGALDRMHGGLDPCVRYDARRKIWIYLHRNRSEADFERMHRQNQTMVKQKQQQRKQKPKKDETIEATQVPPALVAATTPAPQTQPQQASAATVATSVNPTNPVLIRKQSLAQTLPLKVKCPPVPPLKYHIPPTVTPSATTPTNQLMTQQKSLLKTTQRSGVVTILDRSPTASVQLLKTSPKIQQQVQQQQTPLSGTPTRNTTPILVSTPSGLQTVHVASTPNKKLAIKKPILINTTNAQTPVTGGATSGSFVVPLEQQPQQQHTNKAPAARQPMPKNIIRLLPAAGATASIGTSVASKPSIVQLPTTAAAKPPGSVQILGPRMLAQTTVRPLQQKIGAVSIVGHKTATTVSGSPMANASGTIVKMSPQAFATLQQQQLRQKAANAAQAQQQQQPQQQRILVGNTAISSNKNIVFQTLPKATSKLLSTTMPGQTKTLATANLSPQQQRIVLQSFKQPVATSATASQTTTRIIRTTPVSSSTSSTVTQSGQILTLEGLLQKSNSGKLITTGNNIIQLATSNTSGNIITLSPGGQIQQQQQLQQQPQQQGSVKQLATTARIVTAGHGTMVPKIIGKTTVVPGKPLLLQAKTLKLGNNAMVSTQSPTATTTLTTGGIKSSQNIVIGGQTVKLQGGTIPTRNATGAPVQTVIMGNQFLRLATSSSSSTITTTSNSNSNSSQPSTSSGIASVPKTLLIGGGAGQTLRLGKNVLLATSSSSSNNSSNVSTTTTTGTANNLVFAVQNNGGQLFFTPSLQGVNLKPLSGMKVIPMSTTTSVSGVKLGNVTTSTGDAVVGKTLNTKLLPTAVLKTSPN